MNATVTRPHGPEFNPSAMATKSTHKNIPDAKRPSPGPCYHCNHSPYIFGRSPRMYASNVLLSTADQSRSRLSCSTVSASSLSPWACVLPLEPNSALPCPSWSSAARAASSPALNLGPRSGQLREGSNGFHLISDHVNGCKKSKTNVSRRTRSCGNDTSKLL